MKTKRNDFVEIDYVARIKNTNQIFDLTDEKLAKENNIHNPKAKYGPIVICIGQKEVVPGLDNALYDKEPGSYKVELEAKNAFGPRDGRLIKIIPTKVFKEKNINPFPGLPVNIDNLPGVIRSVSGGRTIVDFNNPLAGKAIIYEFKIIRILKNDEEKLKAFIKLHLNIDAELKNHTAIINLKLPDQLQKPLTDKIKSVIPSIKKVKFLDPDKKEDQIEKNQPKNPKNKK